MTLFVTQTYDADGDVAYEFRDARGLQVLTRQKIEAGIYADTYYVYDDSNNLRFVLPPSFRPKLSMTVSFREPIRYWPNMLIFTNMMNATGV